MKANIGRWIILLLALICVVQAASAFNVKTEKINPESGALEPNQKVTAHYVLTYSMDRSNSNDESFEFSTGLQNPSWEFKILRDGIEINKVAKGGYYPVMTEFELSYGEGKIELVVDMHGTVPSSTSGKIEVTRIQHLKDKEVVDEHIVTRDVVNPDQVESSLSAQQQQLKDLKADIDDKASQGVDVSAAQAKYDEASKALNDAASAGPSKAAGYLATATKDMDEAKSLLDKAWAEKEVSDTAEALESLDGMITYFVENRSMGGDPQVVSIVTKRESAVQYYTQAKDNLNTNNYPLARTKAADGLKKANEALADASALREKIGEGFNLGGNLLLYVGIGVVAVLVVAGIVLYRRKTGWDELG